jgi:propanediol utilization protein
MKVRIGISARHVHLTKEDFEILFGKETELTKKEELYRPGEFAANETLSIKGEKGQIDNVRIIGPFRTYTQIEISKTDSYLLGVNPPVRNSGDIIGSAPITLIGPKGELYKEYGCIIAARHIHVKKEEISKYDLNRDRLVSVRLYGEKGGIIDNVHVRLENDTNFVLHLDVDDANAHLIRAGDEGEIIKEEW